MWRNHHGTNSSLPSWKQCWQPPQEEAVLAAETVEKETTAHQGATSTAQSHASRGAQSEDVPSTMEHKEEHAAPMDSVLATSDLSDHDSVNADNGLNISTEYPGKFIAGH
jgi:FKBP-type peptidyl-prolyl cis-trans isomerase